MVLFGLGLGAVQLIPLFETVASNFRQGSVVYSEVIGWAYPWRQIMTFFVPDFFGNPSHHAYWDILNWQWQPVVKNALGQPIQTIAWLKELPTWKNYVEAASYVGILSLVLAVVAFVGTAHPLRLAVCVACSGFAPLHVRHAALCGSVLSRARIQPTAFAIPLGLPLHPEHCDARRNRRDLSVRHGPADDQRTVTVFSIVRRPGGWGGQYSGQALRGWGHCSWCWPYRVRSSR